MKQRSPLIELRVVCSCDICVFNVTPVEGSFKLLIHFKNFKKKNVNWIML